MIMGFNTDIKHNGVVFHVQTERRKDAGVETTVYTRGAVIHKLTTSHKGLLEAPDYSDEKLRRVVEDQHRQVIERIRAGEIVPPAPPSPSA